MSGWSVLGPVPLLLLGTLSLLAWGLVVRRRVAGARALEAPLTEPVPAALPAGTRRGRRRWSAAALVALALLMTTTTAAAAVNDDFAYLPRVGDVAGLPEGEGPWPTATTADLHVPHPRGGVLTLPFGDDGTGLGASSALVWLPPQYFTEPTARFPVLYLFHGSPGVPADWLRGGRLVDTASALAARGLPAIVVVPRMSRGWLDDPECVDGVHERVETHLIATVIPTVDAALRTVPTRQARAFGGMSAGGYCALNLGLKHRDVAGTVLDLSGLVDPTHLGGLSALYGRDPARAASDSPRLYARSLPADPPTRVWLDVGRSDGEVRPGMTDLAPVLRSRGIDTVLVVRPGAHTFHVWRPALADALAWALPAMSGTGSTAGAGSTADAGISG